MSISKQDDNNTTAIDWHLYFSYNEETGNLIWKERGVETFKTIRGGRIWNAQFPNTVAGRSMPSRRIIVGLLGRKYLAHRIIWQMVHGQIPSDIEVDHIDRDAANNRLSNLRLATRMQNSANRGKMRKNTSGYKGVHWDAFSQKWKASIGHGGRLIHLGRFSNPADAAKAYADASVKLNGEFSFCD